MAQPTPNTFTPLGDQHKLIGGEQITGISVQQVYEAAHELLALSRTDRLFL
jgi:hypothetical protein